MRPRRLSASTISQIWRRECGSSPVVGSSRKSSSGSPTRAQASDSRCFWPPERVRTRAPGLLGQADAGERLGRVEAAGVEAAEEGEDLADLELLGELRLLQLDAEPRAQRAAVAPPALAEHLDLPGARREQPLEDLDRRRLARPVRPEQAEALAGRHREVEPVDRHELAVALDQSAALEGGRHGRRVYPPRPPQGADGAARLRPHEGLRAARPTRGGCGRSRRRRRRAARRHGR